MYVCNVPIICIHIKILLHIFSNRIRKLFYEYIYHLNQIYSYASFPHYLRSAAAGRSHRTQLAACTVIISYTKRYAQSNNIHIINHHFAKKK